VGGLRQKPHVGVLRRIDQDRIASPDETCARMAGQPEFSLLYHAGAIDGRRTLHRF
jgi:hypothetical protein